MQEYNISIQNINSYIDKLINQTFSILPLYEELGYSKQLISKIDNLIYRLNGFFEISDFNPIIAIDVLSLTKHLKNSSSHNEVRSCVLKTCTLLSRLKVVSDK